MPINAAKRIVDELKGNPKRFKTKNGYERLLKVLRERNYPELVNGLLSEEAEFVGDVLWTVCELEDVEPYVPGALLHICNRDFGTAAYAVEVVLRGSLNGEQLRKVLHRLVSHQDPVLEHAVRVLAGQGLIRLSAIFQAVGWSWATSTLDGLVHRPVPRETVEDLLFEARRERKILGLVLATLASEKCSWAVNLLKSSEDPWIRDYADWLAGMFGGSWRSED